MQGEWAKCIASLRDVLGSTAVQGRVCGGDHACHPHRRPNGTAGNESKRTARAGAHCPSLPGKRPEQRFHSADDLAFALEALSGSSNRTGAPVARGAIRRGRAITTIALVLVGVGVGIAADRMLRTTRAAESPSYRRLTYERGSLGQARFAPDGNTVVYHAAWRGDPTGVFTIRLDSRESRPLGLSNATLYAVSSKGELAVGLEASEPFGVRDLPSSAPTLSRVPLAGGAPREVLDRVTWADWSPDGSDVAVVRRLENSQRVEFPIGTVLYETNNNLTHLRVSPGASGSRLLIIPGPIRSAPVLW